MNQPVDSRSITFDILSSNDSDEAGAVLLRAMESDDEGSRRLAAEGIVKRQSQQSILEIIRRAETLNKDVCNEFSQSPDRFTTALTHCFSHTENATRQSAIEFIRRTANFFEFGRLLDLLDADEPGICEAAAAAVRDLTDQMATRCRQCDESVLSQFDEQTVRRHRSTVMESFASRTQTLTDRTNPLPVLHSLLTIGNPDDKAIQDVLCRRDSPSQVAAAKLLSEESWVPFFELVCEFLGTHTPPAVIFDVIQSRDDSEFVLHLLHWLPDAPSVFLKRNLNRLRGLSWLHGDSPVLQELSDSVHDRLVLLINLVSLDLSTKNYLKALIVRQSGGKGRAAASDVLKSLPVNEVSSILNDALTHDDPEVEAWATSNLRSQRQPNTFEELLLRLDRNLDVVRNAARDELDSFDLNRVLQLYGQLTPGQGRQCGQALLKINPNVPDELTCEMSHPFRQRRIRAIKAAEALGLFDEVGSGILAALSDPEPTVRYAAIETLGRNPLNGSVQAIKEKTTDESRAVRNAAARALAILSERKKATTSVLASQSTAQSLAAIPASE